MSEPKQSKGMSIYTLIIGTVLFTWVCYHNHWFTDGLAVRRPAQAVRQSPSPAQGQSQGLNIGDVFQVFGKNGNPINTYRSKGDLEVWLKTARAKDKLGAMELVAGKRLWFLDQGTKVRILGHETDLGLYEIRIESGDTIALKGYISQDNEFRR